MIAATSAWIELLRGTGSRAHLRLREALRRGQPVWMPDLVYQELLLGARHPAEFIRLDTVLDQAERWAPADGRETARYAAMLYARCRWQGLTVRSTADCFVAACALEAGVPLLHADRDFEHIAAIEPRLTFA